jgi:ribonuclease J
MHDLSSAPLETFLIGGVGTFGMNMMAVRTNTSTVLIDAGIGFTALRHYGINVRIPDLDTIRAEFGSFDALFLTHGHEDHIGATPFIWDLLDGPIYGTRLTLALVERRLMEHGIPINDRLIPTTVGSFVAIGDLKIELLPVTHSIPDSTAVVVHSPFGTLVHTGDFKFDQDYGADIDTTVSHLAKIGRNGVLAAFSDSTNASRPGRAGSELDLQPSLEHLCKTSTGRVFVTTFASSIRRIQLLISIAQDTGRTIVFLGRGIERNVEIAERLGYISIPPRLKQPLSTLNDPQTKNILCIVSGSQGEALAALARIASNKHSSVSIEPGDTVIFSARVIPGNELSINNVKNKLALLGARVFDNDLELVHVSGHGNRDDLLQMLSLLKPKYLIPIHGEFRDLKCHATLAEQTGIIPLLANNGDRICFENSKGWLGAPIPAKSTYFNDNLSTVIKEQTITQRRAMAKTGILVVICRINRTTRQIEEQPRLITRGVSTENINISCIDDLAEAIRMLLNSALIGRTDEPKALLEECMPDLQHLAKDHFGNAPVILPVLLEN